MKVDDGGSAPLVNRSRFARARMRRQRRLTSVSRQLSVRVIKPTLAQPQPSPPPSPSSAAHSMKPQSPPPPAVVRATTSDSTVLSTFIADIKQLEGGRGAASCMPRHAHIGTHSTAEQTMVENIEQLNVDGITHGEPIKGSTHMRRMALANAARTAQLMHKSRQMGGLVPPKRKPPQLPPIRSGERQIKPPPTNDETVPVPITLQRNDGQITRMLQPQDSNCEAEAATKLSASYRGMQLRKELGKQQAAASKLGSAFRGKAARTGMAELRAKVTAEELKRQNANFWRKLKDTLREEHTLVNFIAPSETEEGLTPAQVVQVFWTMLAFE